MDGVLNNESMKPDFVFKQHPSAVVNVHLVRELSSTVSYLRSYLLSRNIGLKIVISSTWRIVFSLQEFKDFGNQLQEFKPVTDLIPEDEELWRTIPVGGFRGAQILDYLQVALAEAGISQPVSYAIIDDNSDFYPDQPLVKVAGSLGFSVQDSNKLKEIILKGV